MKGIILAGGSGTRLYPLTQSVSKQLMPVYDKPMIYYPLSVLMLAEIYDVLVICTPRDRSLFETLLKDGSQWGIRITYVEQPAPEGLAQAFVLGKDFIGEDDVCLILGDNIFYGHGLEGLLKQSRQRLVENRGGIIFGYQVSNPTSYGVLGFDAAGQVSSVEEKPKHPQSDYAITGLYFFDNSVVRVAAAVQPSARGELEITDVINHYLQQKSLHAEILYRGFAWLDTGTHQSLLEASHYISIIEERQGLKVACLEEIAWRKHLISDQDLQKLAHFYSKTAYGTYLSKLSTRGG